MKPTHVCTYCHLPCDTYETDHGGYEEFWGAKVWRSEYEDLSDCCNSEVWELTTTEQRDIWDAVQESNVVGKDMTFGPVDNQDEVDTFLNELRESGICNMFEAPIYLQESLGMPKDEAEQGFWHWAENFSL